MVEKETVRKKSNGTFELYESRHSRRSQPRCGKTANIGAHDIQTQ